MQHEIVEMQGKLNLNGNLETKEEHDFMDKALSDIVILQEIFLHLGDEGWSQTCHEVRNLRLVSPLWNSALLSMTPPKLRFRLKYNLNFDIFRCAYWPEPEVPAFLEICSTMAPKLARSLFFQMSSNDEQTSENLRHFFQTFPEQLEHVTVRGDEDELAPLLYDILQMAPNLVSLNIITCNPTHPTTFRHRLSPRYWDPFAPLIPIQNKLESVILHRYTASDQKSRHNVPVSILVQAMLHSTPNLTHLNVMDYQCPQLSYCTKLRDLTFFLLPPEGEEEMLQKLEDFSMVLNHVRNSLEKLELNSGFGFPTQPIQTHTDSEIEMVGFNLPEMGKLNYFRNYRLDIFPCLDRIRDLGGSRLPNLGTLHLSKGTDYWKPPQVQRSIEPELTEILEKEALFCNSEGAGGLIRLALDGIRNPDLLKNLNKPFPHLQRLHLRMGDVAMKGIQREELLGKTLTALGPMGLKYLDLVIPFPALFKNFVSSLALLEASLKDMKTMQLANFGGGTSIITYETDFDGIKSFCHVLRSTGRMQTFTIFKCSFGLTGYEEIAKFMKSNNLPVSIPRQCADHNIDYKF
ncbi:uncharacterized protein LOC110861272 isoform X2 [Folsomia candida]|uniref:uncharacterized protein LOC110861272 isoform X2 n=1 Tax=Folsomia candida TaxID=158441 RepID=UPI001604F5EC|nr:uncharacterized protein LOC110861272 isoform X2 [Folsomia candida]